MKTFLEYLEEESATPTNATGDAIAEPEKKLGDGKMQRRGKPKKKDDSESSK